jgi:hypothetical protein
MRNSLKCLKWLATAVIIVGLIVVVSNGFFLSLLEEAGDLGEASTLDLETEMEAEAEVEAIVEIGGPAELGLEVYVPNQDLELDYGVSSEVYRFGLDAEGPYSLRYLSFQVDWVGLRNESIDDASSWKLFQVVGGEVDWLTTIGFGESLADGKLKMRLSSGRGAAFLGEKGKTEFVLTTYVLSDMGSEEDATVSVVMTGDEVSFVPGYYSGSWMSLEEKFGAEFFGGLPGVVVEKR